jgi:hypothetical protein
MTRLRFTLAQLMVLVLCLGLCFAALLNADEFLASVTFTLTTMTISAALVGAFVRKGRARTTWVGFAVFGWAYLLVSRLPDLNTPIAGKLHGPYLLIEWGIAELSPYIYPPGTGINWAEYEQVSHSLGIVLFGLIGAVLARFLAPKDDRPNP